MKEMERNKKRCGIVLFTKNADVLIVLESSFTHKWGVPKGGMEPEDRDKFDCAKRELLEETGIDITSVKYTNFRILKYSNTLLYCLLVDNKLEVKGVPNREILRAKWVPYKSLQQKYNSTKHNNTIKVICQNPALEKIVAKATCENIKALEKSLNNLRITSSG